VHDGCLIHFLKLPHKQLPGGRQGQRCPPGSCGCRVAPATSHSYSWMRALALTLFESEDDANHEAEEGNTFNEGGCNDHRRTNVPGGFRLTRRTFHCGGSQLADTDTCSEGYSPGSDSCSQKCQ